MRTILKIILLCASCLGIAAVCVADSNFIFPNTTVGEAGLWFAFQGDPANVYAALTYDSTDRYVGGSVMGRASRYEFRPLGVLAAVLENDINDLTASAYKPGGGKWGSLSDRRVKKDIHPFTLGLDAVRMLQPRTFKYNGKAGLAPDDGQERIGLIAQETRAAMPMMVHEMPGETIDGTPALAMDTSAMTYALINAVKEQARTIRRLEKEAQDLERMVCSHNKAMCSAATN
jgi:hypothetical protein